MNFKSVDKYLLETSRVIQSLKNHSKEITQISELIYKSQKKNKTIFVCGNGGSDSEAEHFVTELLCTYDNKKRKPISAISLNSSASSISAWSNDFEYNTFLKRSIQAHCKKNDVLFILTTSGGSKKSSQSLNIVNAAIEAHKKNNTFRHKKPAKWSQALFGLSIIYIKMIASVTLTKLGETLKIKI